MQQIGFTRSLPDVVRLSFPEEIAAVSSICQEIGLGRVMPTVLKAAHHTTLLIPSHNIVARVQSGEPIVIAGERACREIAVTRHLAGRGAPALAPLGQFAGPHVTASAVVTFWPYAGHRRTANEEDALLAAKSLAAVHLALRDFADDLPPYTEALDRCWKVLSDDSAAIALDAADRDLLRTEFRRLRHVVEAADASRVSLHGDAHLGNLLLGDDDPLWLDFEDTCVGPREYDIANLPPGIWANFAGSDPTLVAAFADLKSVCVAIWCAVDLRRSSDIREAAGYHLNKVRELAR